MVQHKLAQRKSKKPSISVGAQKALAKKAGAKKRTANRGDNLKLSKNKRKADGQKMDAAITKLINKKNEEALRGRAAADHRAGKN